MYTKIQKIRWFQSDESSERRMKWLLISDGRMDLQGIQEESMHSSQKSKEERLVQFQNHPELDIPKHKCVLVFPKHWLGMVGIIFFHHQKMTGNIINHNCSNDWDISWDISPDISWDISWDIPSGYD